MTVRWWRVLLLLVVGIVMAAVLHKFFGIGFWERLLIMQIPLMLLVWLVKPVRWSDE